MARKKKRQTASPPRRRRRNASPPRRRRRTAAPPPDLTNTFASVAGGGGGALLGGILANRGWDPAMVALAMTVGGGVGAYTLDGGMRIAANGLAAAGAGQLALSLLAKQAEPETPETPEPAGKAARKAPSKTSNASHLPPGAIESAFERARHRLAIEDDFDPYDDVIDVEDVN